MLSPFPHKTKTKKKILTRDCVTISVDAVIYWRTSHSDRVICVVDNVKYYISE